MVAATLKAALGRPCHVTRFYIWRTRMPGLVPHGSTGCASLGHAYSEGVVAMSVAELPITGYLDRFSGRPGETLAAHVSVHAGGSYRARLARVICADPNPAGPGMRFEDFQRCSIALSKAGIRRSALARTVTSPTVPLEVEQPRAPGPH